jgi:branched-chain amino acid transport system substrate-binding protein
MKANHLKTAFIVITVLLLLAAELTIPPETKAAEPYHLGVALGLSGTGAPYSAEALEGIEMAVNEINIRGGILGKHPIELHIRDTRTRPDRAVKVVTSLIGESKVRSIIGTYSSACAIAIKPVCRKNRVLHMATVSNSEAITKDDYSPFTFSVVPNTYMMAKGVVRGISQLVEQKGWTQYATIASDYAWGRSSQQIQVELLRKIAPDLKLIGAYWPRLGQTRFNSFIVDIMAKKPDFVLSTIGGADNSLWLRDARDYRLFKQVARPGGLVSVSELIAQARSIRRGLYGRCRAPFFAHMNVPVMAQLVESYKSKFDRYPTDWAIMSYDGVYALKQGIEKAGTIDSEKVKDALKGLSIDTTRGPLYFREIDNQLSCSAYFGRVADDAAYRILIYHNLLEIKGIVIWRPEEEIVAARSK